MSVLKIKDNEGNWVGVTAIQGEKGESGVSPKITVNTNTSTTYKLRVTTEDKDFITPNLKGSGGIGGGNVSSELGTIDNYKDFDGENIPCYNMDLPPLPMFRGGTRYAFERPVTMLIYTGAPDENDNYDIDQYKTIEAELNEDNGLYEVYVPTVESGFLTDYLIYNPIPKKEWDTWENPNLVNFMKVEDKRLGAINKADDTMILLPNCRLSTGFKSGDSWLAYTKWADPFGEYYTKDNDLQVGVYRREDFPFILDEPVLFSSYDAKEQIFNLPVEVPYPSDQWRELMNEMPCFACGNDYTLDGELQLGCCGEEDGWGNTILMNIAEDIRDENKLETREFDLVIASSRYINNQMKEHQAKPLAPAMYVGLKPLKNYTIETTAGDCALVLPGNRTKKFITKRTELAYPSVMKSVVVKKARAQDVGMNDGGLQGGAVTGAGKLESGTVLYYNIVDKSVDPLGLIECPTALSCPNVYLKRGESYTFQVEDEDEMWGCWVMCLQEEDYKGIKIVEGIEPYSTLMEERMASGATKFNLKVYTEQYDDNEIMAEYNIKLSDNTTDDDYCRFLTNNTIKHFDLDDFTMNGHTHSVEEMTDLEERLTDLRVPTMKLNTATLVDGESELAENTFYFVYEE